MTTKEFKKLIVDVDKKEEFKSFIENYYENNEIVIGDFVLKHFNCEGGEGQGDTMKVLFKLIKDGNEDLFQVNGYYDSYNGTEFYNPLGSVFRIKPIQVMRTEYQAVKEED